MEPLSWTGNLAFLNPIFLYAWVALAIAIVVQIVASFMATEANLQGEVTTAPTGPHEYAALGVKLIFGLILLMILVYIVGGILMPSVEAKGIIGTIATRLLPVWIALAVTFALSITFKAQAGAIRQAVRQYRRHDWLCDRDVLGLYGDLRCLGHDRHPRPAGAGFRHEEQGAGHGAE